MKKTHLGLSMYLVVLLSFGSCQKSDQKHEEMDTKPLTEISEGDLVEFQDEHNAQNSLDFMGVYKGILPCADCEGIEILLELESGNSYTKKVIYHGKTDQKTQESSGIFSWNEAGNTITLVGEALPNQYFVGENHLFHLDIEGNRITGDLAAKYRLTKN
ncbi:copper resistance protein NlpE [Rhodonellum sp.]|uniref:copper resistance protein NlpE n=1 Tax=Rhodonellum sp. TaxID=2231180 RepID=UPI00271ABC4C|nr:copper resistance protein NlpE [Rhodonellum sp.]MDO9554431.1 copper resistance protein NlpE [Rhodonellum sp.]